MMLTGSLVALVTPFDSRGQVDFDCLHRLIDWHIDQGTSGLVIAGTTGESATLETAEHIELIRVAVEQVAGRVPVLAGTGSNSTAQTIELSVAVARFAIDACLVVTPYYNKPTQEGLVQHFTAIADAVDKPIMLYNVPGRTAVDLLPETAGRLAGHPRIMGIKEATGEIERAGRLKALCGPEFGLYSGDDATARAFMLAGGHGVISVTGNVAPRRMAEMCRSAIDGDTSKAEEADRPLLDLHRDLFIESNPIPVKWALERMGRISGTLRLPLTMLAKRHQAAVEAALKKAGAINA